jgi:hypothetical protein
MHSMDENCIQIRLKFFKLSFKKKKKKLKTLDVGPIISVTVRTISNMCEHFLPSLVPVVQWFLRRLKWKKKLQTTGDDDGHKVITIPHMTF